LNEYLSEIEKINSENALRSIYSRAKTEREKICGGG
jgi:hypothetical protein